MRISDTQEIRVQHTTYKDKKYVDIRKYFNDNPTTKGIMIPLNLWSSLLEEMNELDD